MRRVLAPAVLAFAALALPAVAAAPACRLVTDPADDTTPAGPVPAAVAPVDRPAYDVRSADVATNSTWLTVAVRVRDLPAAATGVTDGARYDVRLTVGAARYVVYASRVVGGTVSGLARVVPPSVPVVGEWSEQPVDADTRATFDTARDEVRVSVRIDAFEATGGVPAGTTISDITAATWTDRALRPMSTTTSTRDRADVATTTRTYVAGARSCLRPGA